MSDVRSSLKSNGRAKHAVNSCAEVQLEPVVQAPRRPRRTQLRRTARARTTGDGRIFALPRTGPSSPYLQEGHDVPLRGSWQGQRHSRTSAQGTHSMRLFDKLPWLACLLVAGAAAPAIAQEATEAPAAEAAAGIVSGIDSGDTAWMLTSALLVLFMILPGLALFYGGLVRTKNMLSVLMQCTIITATVMVLYVLYGYSLSFGGSESAFWGGFAKVFLAGVTPDSELGTIPELVFVSFQMTFACITPALIVGGFA